MTDWIAWFKVFMAALGGGLMAAAQSVEPSEAVWIMASAGGLLGVAIGEDKSVKTILTHVGVGVVGGVAGANLVEFLMHFPRAPVAFVVGLVAARMLVAINKDIDEGRISVLPKWFRKGA